MNTSERRQWIEHLSRSEIYRDYEKAFSEATGMPLSLRPVESWQLTHHGKKHENPFCVLMSQSNKTCAACLDAQQKMSAACGHGDHAPQSVTCFAGLRESSIPIDVGGELLGFLQTGEVMLHEPSRSHFDKLAKQIAIWELKVDLRKLEEAYFHTRVVAPKQYEAMLRLLVAFAQHLSLVANQLVLQAENVEPLNITRAREFIVAHENEELSLAAVAKAVNMSAYYFCKKFKRVTGFNFTDYLARVRIEKAKNLLLNPNLRVSEIAYEIGFQSVTHFNRTFKKLAGHSPSEYRDALPHGAKASVVQHPLNSTHPRLSAHAVPLQPSRVKSGVAAKRPAMAMACG